MTSKLVVGPEALGTPEAMWVGSDLGQCPPFDLSAISRAVIIAPHPDDEVLALGGMMRLLAQRAATVSIVAVTDGEASHPRLSGQLAGVRAAERVDALIKLGAPQIRVTRLRIADGSVAREKGLAEWLVPLIAEASHCFAPWELDGHPDHDACGRAAQLACQRARIPLLRYPVWAWHWATPATFPWLGAHRLELDRPTLDAKLAAIAAYRSQIALLDGEVILPPQILARFQRPFEVVLA